MGSVSFQRDVPLAPLTTLKVGGKAEYFCRLRSPEELAEAVAWSVERELPFHLLGGGSNAVISDRGLPGVTGRWEYSGIRVLEDDGKTVTVEVLGGTEWDELVSWSVRRGLWGLEALSGIPGTAGAAPIQNIGAYGTELAELLISAKLLNLQTGEVVQWEREEFEFSYRNSSLKGREKGKFAVLSSVLALTREAGGPPNYPDYRKLWEEKLSSGLSDSPALRRQVVLHLREKKGMLVGVGNFHSAGSFFVNPVLSREKVDELKSRLRKFLRREVDIPLFSLPDGRFKVPAARLIELAGFTKGFRWGAVGISPFHSLAIVNFGGASAFEIAQFALLVRDKVANFTGIRLTPEPDFLGDFSPFERLFLTDTDEKAR